MTQLALPWSHAWGTPAKGEVPKRTDDDLLAAYVARHGVRLSRRTDSPRMLEVYTLCFHLGMSKAECADRLGIGFETVREYLRRLRQRARRAMPQLQNVA